TPSPPTERTYPTWFFFQRIKRWTNEQLDALNISFHEEIPPNTLISNNYNPTRKDREAYANLLKAFTEPTELDISEYNPTSTMMRNNKLQNTFHLLSMMWDIAVKGEAMPFTTDLLLDQLGRPLEVFSENFLIDTEPIPFHLRKFNMNGKLHCNGGIYHLSDDKRNLPLVVFAKKHRPFHLRPPTTTQKHEISHVLLPITMDYDHGLRRPNYTGFCICVYGTEYQITRADASRTYFEDLCHGRPTNEKLVVNQTVVYDLMWKEDRRAFLEVFVGMCSFL
ncbi:hypothetical protein BO94DRAFT_444261, partial [Aspergillus sclerotioniger CBS 115572]